MPKIEIYAAILDLVAILDFLKWPYLSHFNQILKSQKNILSIIKICGSLCLLVGLWVRQSFQWKKNLYQKSQLI